MSQNYEWIGLFAWWFNLDANGQAAWVQAIGSILAIIAAIFISYWQKYQDRRDREIMSKRQSMRIALSLNDAIIHDIGIIEFIKTKLDLDSSNEFSKYQGLTYQLSTRLEESLTQAIASIALFNEHLCIELLTTERTVNIYKAFSSSAIEDEVDSSRMTRARLAKEYLPVMIEKLHQLSDNLQNYIPNPLQIRSRHIHHTSIEPNRNN